MFDYDAFYRLDQDSTSSSGYGPRNDGLTYDAANNRTGVGGTWTYTASNAVRGRPATSGDPYAPGDSLLYDNAGNPIWWKDKTTGTIDSLTWDALNRLTRHRRFSGSTPVFDVKYGYDGLGRRVWRIDGTDTTLFVWDGWQPLAETSGSGTALRRYTAVPGALDFPLAMRAGSTSSYFRRDGQGNIYRLTSATGATQAEYRYRAWGDRYNVSSETVVSPFTYKGREEDRTTGLVYMRHRWYSPRLERFVNEDPIGVAGGLNVYEFAGSSPANASDPLGLCSRWDYKVTEGDREIARWSSYDLDGCLPFFEFMDALASYQFFDYSLRWGVSSSLADDCPKCGKGNTPTVLATGRSQASERTAQQCWEENTAPVREWYGRHRDAVLATGIVGNILRGVAVLSERRGTLLRAGGVTGFGGAMAAGGSALFAGTTWVSTAGAGLAASYFAASSVVCDIDPEW